jgi:glutamine cyclotransferase
MSPDRQKREQPSAARAGVPGSRSLLRRWALLTLALLLGLGGATAPFSGDAAKAPTPVFGYQVVRTYPHDPEAYTQGLVFHEGHLYESTGLYGRSSVRQVELETGRVLQTRPLEPRYFGEGLALWEERWIQLTWQSRTALVYDRRDFRLLEKIPYPREGWGLTGDGRSLIASDGSDRLYFLDPRKLTERRRVTVTDQGLPVAGLNELEYVRERILANVYLSDRLAVISPQTGEVSAWVDLTGLLPAALRTPRTDVLNGIAYDAPGDRLFVTGKNWPLLYEIRLLKNP